MSVDKDKLKNLGIMSAENLEKGQNLNKDFVKIKTKNANFKALKDEFDEKFTNAIKELEFVNDETNIKARIGRTGIKEIISNVEKSVKNGFTFNHHFAVALDLPNIFKKAKYQGKFKDDKYGDPNVSIHRFKNNVLINDKIKATAFLLLKEWQQNGKKIYSLKLDKLEKRD